MTEDLSPPKKSTGKLLSQLAFGGLIGGGGMYLAITYVENMAAWLDTPERMLAIAVGIVFGFMTLMTLLGVAFPKFGLKLLEMEDEQELQQERKNLIIGGSAMGALAVIPFTLAFAGTSETGESVIGPEAAAWIIGAALLFLTVIGYRYRNLGDELNDAIVIESGANAFYLSVLVFGGWAALAHLGLAPQFAMLTLVAGMFALWLLTIFIAIAKRGMM